MGQSGRLIMQVLQHCQPDPQDTGTLGYILNNCPNVLNRYEWRHNGVAAFLYQDLRKNKPDDMEVYADIEGPR